MGKRGPAKTPTRLRVLRGEKRPSQINYLEPQVPAPSSFVAPDTLDEAGKAIWDTTVAALAPSKVLGETDLVALAHYCEAEARYQEAVNMLRRSGPMIRGRNGEFVANPLHRIVRDNDAAVRAYARELGLTPAARAGLRSDQQVGDAGSALDALFAARKRLG